MTNKTAAPRLIAPDLLWRDGALARGMALEIKGGRVAAVRPRRAADAPDFTPRLLTPGLVDLQVNGGGGAMMNGDATPEGLSRILAAHRGLGTTRLLATVITDAPETLTRAVDLACDMFGEPGLLGLHIEGPHINPAKRGTHDARFIRPPDAVTWAALGKLRARGVPTMVTLAPEMVAEDDLRAMVDLGVIVSLGHSAADAATAKRAFALGARCVTHLYNAMPPMLSRAPGLLGAALAGDAWCGIIADGIHVDFDMVSIALRGRPRPDRCFLVSDAMATVGGPDNFNLYGKTIKARGGRLVNDEGALAGAHVDLATCLRNVVTRVGLKLEQALPMAIDAPLAAMRLPPPKLEGAPLLDLRAFDADMRRVFP